MVHGKISRVLPPLRITKKNKKAQESQDEMQKNNMKLISGGMIGNYNYIGTSLNGLIINLTPKELNPFLFLRKCFILVKMIQTKHNLYCAK